MSMLTQPITLEAKKRRSYRRLLLLSVLLVFGSLAGWMIWNAIQERIDANALEVYFTELELREPTWRERVYGKPLNQQQINDHEKWNALQQLLATSNAAWIPYRQGLYGGMYQNPEFPAAMLPPEQIEFMKAAHQYWQPMIQKVEAMENWPGVHRSLDHNMPYEKLIDELNKNSSTAYAINEAVELEAMYHIMKNDPDQAMRWIERTKSPNYVQLCCLPFLVERLLNLTQPGQKALQQMQVYLEKQVRECDREGFFTFGTELRLQEQLLRQLSRNELTHRQMDRLGIYQSIVGKDSAWNGIWLKWAQSYYLDTRIYSVFHRSNYLILRLHRLADRIEELARLHPAIRWSTWRNFATDNSIITDIKILLKGFPPIASTDAIPEGLYLLGLRNIHMRIVFLFDIQAQISTTLTAVIAERFRIDHGRFPKDWSEMSPRYIPEPILDPYTGKPFLIKLNEKGIVIYSTGRDGKDNGGEHLNHNHYWIYGGKGWDMTNTNLGTRVYLPEFRRGPAAALDSMCSDVLKENLPKLLKIMKEDQTKKE